MINHSNQQLTNPAGLLGIDHEVPGPDVLAIGRVPGDVEEGGQGGPGVGDGCPIEQTAQGGAHCGQKLQFFPFRLPM